MADEQKFGAIKRAAQKAQMITKKILLVLVGIILPVAAFVVGARLFDTGQFLSKGSSVRITGMCLTKGDNVRDDLAQDQMIITHITDSSIEGTLRKTREYVICDRNKVSLESLAPISELFTAKEDAIPELKKFEAPKVEVVVQDFKKYENKTFLISGICTSSEGKSLPAFFNQKVQIGTVKEIKEDKNDFLFYGIREDKVTMLCKKSDVTMQEVSTNVSANFKPADVPLSYVDKVVAVTGLCFPDMRVYNATNQRPLVNFYQLTGTKVQVVEEEIKDGQITAIAGIIADKDAKIENISIYTHRVTCDSVKYKLGIKPIDDESIQFEKSTNVPSELPAPGSK